MDSKFLEFWGNYLLAAARGQQQLEDLNQWIQQGFSGFEELTGMFKKFYGIERPAEENTDTALDWQKAAAGFRDSFNAYLELMGVVPRDKYQALEQKYDALIEKVADQEETIKILRDLLAEEGTYQGETVKVFQNLIEKQSEAFETLIKNLNADAKDENEQ